MKFRFFYWVVGLLLIAGAGVGGYFLGRYSTPEYDLELVSELDRLRSLQTDAVVTKRVSKQMEDIAYQQKAVSDIERVRAEEQSRLAISMRERAENESRTARVAEAKAVEAADEARQQRASALDMQRVAEEQRDEANYSKRVADTLACRILGRTIGASSLVQYECGNVELASQLAYTSWYFLNSYGGNTYQNETFEALSICSNSRGSIQTKKGGAVTAMCSLNNSGCVVVTDYGEVEQHRIVGSRRKILYQNSKYNFIGVWADTSVIYALSNHGPLCRLGYDGNLEEIPLPAGTYMKLLRFSDEKLLVAERNSLCMVDVASGKVLRQASLEGALTDACVASGRIHLYLSDGRHAVADSLLDVTFEGPSVPGVVTASCYDDSLSAFFLGLDDGSIVILNREGKPVSTVYGHSSRVTDIAVLGQVAVSTSYDKRLFVWNLPMLYTDWDVSLIQKLGISDDDIHAKPSNSSNEWLSPASVSYTSWALSVCGINENIVMVGTGSGTVQILNVSTDSMARKIRNGLSAPLTPQEWIQYVGSTIPYVRL